MLEHRARMQNVDHLRGSTTLAEQEHRDSQVANLSQERNMILAELANLEVLRANDRQITSAERNTIALTRENAASDAADGYYDRYDADASASYTQRKRHKKVYSRTEADAYAFETQRGAGAAVCRFAASRGLNDGHYADVNRREADYHDYLVYRRRNLNRRLHTIAKREKDLRCKPVTGTSPQLRSMVREASSLTTYIALPVELASELQRMTTPKSTQPLRIVSTGS